MKTHWSMSKPSNRGYTMQFNGNGANAQQAKVAMRQARNLITDNVFGGAVTAERFFSAASDAAFAQMTLQSARKIDKRA